MLRAALAGFPQVAEVPAANGPSAEVQAAGVATSQIQPERGHP